MPLGGEPLIERSLRQIEGWGIREIAVNLHWQAGGLRDYLQARPGAARFIYSYEPRLLGTGGALQAFREFLKGEPFWIVNADIVWQVAPGPLVHARRDGDALAALWLVPERGPRTVETDADGRITTFRSARRGSPGTATFSGVQLVSPRLLGYLPDDPAKIVSLVELYEAATKTGERVLGVTAGARTVWDDAGTLPDYLRLRKRYRRIRPPAYWNPLAQPFDINPKGEVWYDAASWPDPALAPLLSNSGFTLGKTKVAPLDQRGSDRSFLRIRNGAAQAIFVRHGNLRDENLRYAGHARLLLEAGLAVPRVLAESREARALLLEDVGKENLLDQLRRCPGSAERLYRKTLDQVVLLHTAATRLARSRRLEMEPAFDRRLYDWERDLFLNQIVRKRHAASDAVNAEVIAEYARVATVLLDSGETVIVHRDLQSTNVMLKQRRLSLIDFQGMRYGPAAYDLASLLCDPYANLPPDLRGRLLDYYAIRIGAAEGAVQRLFCFGAVQRLTQALGAYGRLTSLGLQNWQRHIIPAAERLAEMAARCGLGAIRQLAVDTLHREQLQQAKCP
jgi:aminoglycoside/choline kinase family phosphotransferase